MLRPCRAPTFAPNNTRRHGLHRRKPMSVRRRIWKSPNGEPKEAWVVDYVDQHGERHIKTFAKKRDADAHHTIVGVAVRNGTHAADSKSITVARAAELWLESCETAGLERTTLDAYRQLADLHI